MPRIAKRNYAKRTAARQTVRGHGAYKKKGAGGGGQHYYKKYKEAKQAAASNTSDGWLSNGLGTIGSMLLPGIGGPIGRGVGSLIKSVTGFGDYDVKHNSLIPEAGAPPLVANVSNDKVFIVRHREFISDIISSSSANTFKIENYFINPAQSATFSWLSGLASNFEHYQIRGMMFEYRTMSSDALNSTNTALGQVILATQYNSALPNFANKYEMENYEFGQSVKPSCSVTHPIECARSESVLGDLYCRIGAVPSGQDQRLYDFGNFQIASNGVQGTSVNLGELWVTYEVALYKPKLNSALGLNNQVFQVYSDTLSSGNPFGGNQTLSAQNTLGITCSSTGLVTFPNNIKYGTYFIRYRVSGTATALTYGATDFAGTKVNCSINNTNLVPQANPATQDSFDITARVDISASPASFTVRLASTAVPTASISTFEVMQLPLGFTPFSAF